MDTTKQGLTSASHSEYTLEALRQIVPSAFTEVRGSDGKLTHKIDFDVLRELLGDAIADSPEESFGFTWVGKQAAKRAAAEPTRQTLRPVKADSLDWDTTENLYIEGDNLEVLKLLQRAYLGKVKMIYIDPPYNTGNDFVYDDDFAMSGAELDTAMGNVDAEGNRLRKNLNSNPRYHSDWCSMIYSRLLVARTLLANDGVIFISIDDNEVHHLRKICDEVFGAENFVAEYKWNKTSTPPSLSYKVRGKFEYILCYEKQLSTIKYNGGTVEGGDMPLLNEGNNVRTLTFPKEYVSFNINGTFEAGNYDRVRLERELNVTNGSSDTELILTGAFKWTQETLEREVREGTRFIVKSNKFAVRYARIGERIKRPSDVISKVECGVGTNEEANKDLEVLFGKNVMSYPKPVSLIKYLIPFAETNKNSLILDFFSGSATTAHAVMQLNAEDGGKRKYICVQLPEATSEGSEACKAGYSTICEIGKERIRRAGKKIKEEHPEVADSLDTGFRVLRVDSSNMEDVYFEPAQLSQASLFSHVDNVKEGRTELDLLFGCMVDWGVNLSLPLRKEEVAGKSLHIVNAGELVACFDSAINLEVIRYIAGLNPLRVIFRETCFTSDVDKLNLYEQFKQFCGWSDEEAYKRIHVI